MSLCQGACEATKTYPCDLFGTEIFNFLIEELPGVHWLTTQA